MSQYDASMDELQLMSGDASSEDSMPSMLDTQSTYPAMASAGKLFMLHPLTHAQSTI